MFVDLRATPPCALTGARARRGRSGRGNVVMLEARGVALSRGGRTLVHDASFLIGRGEKVGLVGVNGAGKTTLLHALRGTLDPIAAVSSGPGALAIWGRSGWRMTCWRAPTTTASQ